MTTYARHPEADIDDLHRAVHRLRHGRRPSTYRRRRVALLVALAGLVVMGGELIGSSARTDFPIPSRAALAGLDVRRRIVALVESQLGYRTDPGPSYCNSYSAYWGTGGAGCPGGTRSEAWCADFAAWAWRQAGVSFAYGFADGEINAGAVSFYEWAVLHGRWHPVRTGYRPRAGDVAVYGLSLSPSPSAAHVAVVVGVGEHGPDVINGDGDRTAHSAVERVDDEIDADTGTGAGAPLAGYVEVA